MLDRPEYWQSHYHGDGNARRLARGYSYSDRVRYYWPDQQIDEAFARLVRNLADTLFHCRSSASICRYSTPECAKGISTQRRESSLSATFRTYYSSTTPPARALHPKTHNNEEETLCQTLY